MLSNATLGLCAGLVALAAARGAAAAQDAIAAPAQKTIGVAANSAMIPSLAVINLSALRPTAPDAAAIKGPAPSTEEQESPELRRAPS
jgi:hypothetical protein